MADSSHQKFNVGVKALVYQNSRVLILKVMGEDFWKIPGGRIDQDEGIEDTLAREIREELPAATNIQIHEIIHAQKGQFPLADGFNLMLLFFRVTVTLPDAFAVSAEHEEARWVTAEKVGGFDMPGPDRRAIAEVLAL